MPKNKYIPTFDHKFDFLAAPRTTAFWLETLPTSQ
jgi:hypothetical protein